MYVWEGSWETFGSGIPLAPPCLPCFLVSLIIAQLPLSGSSILCGLVFFYPFLSPN